MKQNFKFLLCIFLSILMSFAVMPAFSYALTYESYLQAGNTSVLITGTQISQLNWGPIYDSEVVGSTLKQYVMHSVYSNYQNIFKTVTLNSSGNFDGYYTEL